MSITKATQLDLSKISFSDVKLDNHGRKMVYVNYNGGKIMMQTPKMYIPNGIKRWRKKDAVDNKDDSFEMEMSFGGESSEIRVFHDKMVDFDTLVKKNIMSHSKEWLGKTKISMDSIEEAFYAPTVRVATDKDGNVLDYPSRIKAKLDREMEGDSFTGRFLSNKRFKTPVLMFDDNKQQLDLNESNFESVVPKGSQVVAVLELVYLSITTKVSAKWKLVQGKVSKNQQSITGYAMLDDGAEGAVAEEGVEQDVVDGTEGAEGVEEDVVEDADLDTVDGTEDVDDDEEIVDDLDDLEITGKIVPKVVVAPVVAPVKVTAVPAAPTPTAPAKPTRKRGTVA